MEGQLHKIVFYKYGFHIEWKQVRFFPKICCFPSIPETLEKSNCKEFRRNRLQITKYTKYLKTRNKKIPFFNKYSFIKFKNKSLLVINYLIVNN